MSALERMASALGYAVRMHSFEDGQTIYFYVASGVPVGRITRLWDEGSVIEAAMEWLAEQEVIREDR